MAEHPCDTHTMKHNNSNIINQYTQHKFWHTHDMAFTKTSSTRYAPPMLSIMALTNENSEHKIRGLTKSMCKTNQLLRRASTFTWLQVGHAKLLSHDSPHSMAWEDVESRVTQVIYPYTLAVCQWILTYSCHSHIKHLSYNTLAHSPLL